MTYDSRHGIVVDGTQRLVDQGICTYRQIDHWCRTGKVTLQRDASGSGTRRHITEQEAAGIVAVADAYYQMERLKKAINDGTIFAEGARGDR